MFKITESIIDEIYADIVEGYEVMRKLEGEENLLRLRSKKYYHDIIMAQKDSLQTYGSPKRVAQIFLDELRQPLKYKEIQVRFTNWTGFGTKQFFELVDTRIAELEATEPDFDIRLAQEVRNDMQTLRNIQLKFMNDPEYRDMFMRLFYAGTRNNYELFHNLVSPDDGIPLF